MDPPSYGRHFRRKSTAERKAQRLRATGRVVSQMLSAFGEIACRRGNRLSVLASALQRVLQPADVAAAPASRPGPAQQPSTSPSTSITPAATTSSQPLVVGPVGSTKIAIQRASAPHRTSTHQFASERLRSRSPAPDRVPVSGLHTVVAMGSSIINIGDPAASSTAPVTVVTVRGSEASGQPTAIDQDLEDMILENETALRSALSELASAREAQDEDLMSQVQEWQAQHGTGMRIQFLYILWL